MINQHLYDLLRSNLKVSDAKEVCENLTITEEVEKFLETVAKKAEKIKTRNSSLTVVKETDIEARELANMLSKYVLQKYPYYESKINVVQWSKDIQALHKTDKHAYNMIESVIRYIFEVYEPYGDFDWREQIRSGKNLRKHFIRIYEQAKKDYNARSILVI